MRNLFFKFQRDESGASLVEYAVALIVVTIIGGAGVILLGQAGGRLATNADAVVSSACNAGGTNAGVIAAGGNTTGC